MIKFLSEQERIHFDTQQIRLLQEVNNMQRFCLFNQTQEISALREELEDAQLKLKHSDALVAQTQNGRKEDLQLSRLVEQNLRVKLNEQLEQTAIHKKAAERAHGIIGNLLKIVNRKTTGPDVKAAVLKEISGDFK